MINDHLDSLRKALARSTPATGPGLDPDAYPGLQISRAPAAATEVDALVGQALEAVGWPERSRPVPLASELTAPQRALAELLAGHPGLALGRWAIPQTSRSRRAWLGLEDGGAVNREVGYTVAGKAARAPLWLALAELADDEAQAETLFRALPLADRLEVYGDLMFDAYRVEPPAEITEPLGVAGAAWAPAQADRLLGLFSADAPHAERAGYTRPPEALCRLVVRALIEARIPIEPRWDELIPADLVDLTELPVVRRDALRVRKLVGMFPSQAIRTGLELLERAPSRPIVEHLLERAEQCLGSLMCPPRRQLAARIRAAVIAEPALVRLVDAYLETLPPLPVLRCTRKLYPTSADQLTDGQRTQLAILGQGWETDDDQPMVQPDGDGQPRFGRLEFVSAFEIADADGNPAFEALLYMDEDGAVCRAGTTNSVAYVCQTNLSWNIDPLTIEALHAILHERPPR